MQTCKIKLLYCILTASSNNTFTTIAVQTITTDARSLAHNVYNTAPHLSKIWQVVHIQSWQVHHSRDSFVKYVEKLMAILVVNLGAGDWRLILRKNRYRATVKVSRNIGMVFLSKTSYSAIYAHMEYITRRL